MAGYKIKATDAWEPIGTRLRLNPGVRFIRISRIYGNHPSSSPTPTTPLWIADMQMRPYQVPQAEIDRLQNLAIKARPELKTATLANWINGLELTANDGTPLVRIIPRDSDRGIQFTWLGTWTGTATIFFQNIDSWGNEKGSHFMPHVMGVDSRGPWNYTPSASGVGVYKVLVLVLRD
ncbi:hypothetical protein QVA66_09180 [Staphylococcus chromogenes]|nr:hypothetical protein [Staphylococcus chromogenes]